jgi:hypothetical protein
MGYVNDKETGEPIAGANVWAANCQDADSAVTNASGYYSMELDYDNDCTTWVVASADTYEALRTACSSCETQHRLSTPVLDQGREIVASAVSTLNRKVASCKLQLAICLCTQCPEGILVE